MPMITWTYKGTKYGKNISWGAWFLIAMITFSIMAVVFTGKSVKEVNETLVIENTANLDEYVPLYDWFNGSTPINNHPQLDEPLELDPTLTLKLLFESSNLIVNYDFSIDLNNNELADNWVAYYAATPFLMENNYQLFHSSRIGSNTIYQNINVINSNVYYYNVKFLETTGSYYTTRFQNVSNNTTTNIAQNKSVKYTATSTTTTQFEIGFNSTVIGQYASISFVYLINLTPLGITTLTLTQIDDLFTQYQYYKNYVDFDIYSYSAYDVPRETLIYYYERYLTMLDNYVERPDITTLQIDDSNYNNIGNQMLKYYGTVLKVINDVSKPAIKFYEFLMSLT